MKQLYPIALACLLAGLVVALGVTTRNDPPFPSQYVMACSTNGVYGMTVLPYPQEIHN